MSMTRKRVYAEAFPAAPAYVPAQGAGQPPKGLGKKAAKKAAAAARANMGLLPAHIGTKDKGKKGKGKGGPHSRMPQGIRLQRQTPDGSAICFAFGTGACPGSCGKLHACQVCFETGHAYPACPKVAQAGGMRAA